MINANPLITRCVRTALCTYCPEIKIPLGQTTAGKPPSATSPTAKNLENLAQALDQLVANMDPNQAAALFALRSTTTPPGEAATINAYLNELLLQKTKAEAASSAPGGKN